MNTRRWCAAALLSVLVLLAGACGEDEEATPAGGTGRQARPVPRFDPGTTMAGIQAKGKLVVGTKYDQPGFGQQNPTTNRVEGFDVEVAKLVAVAIFGGDLRSVEGKVEFVETVTKNREPFIADGKVDIVAATYTINDARKQVVDFAGPYFIAEQDIMVKSEDQSIKNVNDLNGKSVCTAKGSTSEKNLAAKAPRSQPVLFDTYSQCAEALRDGRVRAVTTDNSILSGLVSASNRAFKLVEAPFSSEPYGIGLRKGDQAFRDFLNDRLEEIFRSGEWADAFNTTLGRIGLKLPRTPLIDRYPATVTGGATTTSTTAPTTTSTTGGAATTSTTVRY